MPRALERGDHGVTGPIAGAGRSVPPSGATRPATPYGARLGAWRSGLEPHKPPERARRRTEPGADDRPMVSVTVVTYNMGDGPDERKREDLLLLLDAGARVICLQEAGDRRSVLEAFCAEVGWVLWRGF